MQPLDAIRPVLQQYLKTLLKQPVQLQALEQIFGGGSRQTWRILLQAGDTDRRLIMRRTQPSALIETEQEVESGAMRAFADSPVAVPCVLATAVAGSADAQKLEAPFMLVEELPGAPATPFDSAPYDPHRQAIGTQFWSTLGHIAADKQAARRFADFAAVPEPQDCWRVELDKWQTMIHQDSLGPEPVLQAAIRWLQAHPPPPPPAIVAVHGDYRSGNFLYADDQITGILDWEMAHLGDPLEDVAWAMTPLWSPYEPDCPSALLQRQQGLDLWSSISGFEIQPQALHWWEIFAAVKGMAIWVSACKEFASGSNEQPVNLFSAWVCKDMQLQTLIAMLAPEGTPGMPDTPDKREVV